MYMYNKNDTGAFMYIERNEINLFNFFNFFAENFQSFCHDFKLTLSRSGHQ